MTIIIQRVGDPDDEFECKTARNVGEDEYEFELANGTWRYEEDCDAMMVMEDGSLKRVPNGNPSVPICP